MTNGYFSRPTWALVTWLLNDLALHNRAVVLANRHEDPTKFELALKRDLASSAYDCIRADVNPSGRADRWDSKIPIDWLEVRLAICGTPQDD